MALLKNIDTTGDSRCLKLSLFDDVDINDLNLRLINICSDDTKGSRFEQGFAFIPQPALQNWGMDMTLNGYYKSYWNYRLVNVSCDFALDFFGKYNDIMCSDSGLQLVSISRWAHKNGVPHRFIDMKHVFEVLHNTAVKEKVVENVDVQTDLFG